MIKRNTAACLILLLLVTLLSSCADDAQTLHLKNTDSTQKQVVTDPQQELKFRNVEWGMTKEKVMDNETAELPTFGSIFEYLDYNIDIFGQNGELSYYFDYNDDEDYEEGRLESASIDYEYDIYEYNINDAETAFAKFKNLYKKLKQEYETVIGTDIDTQVTIYQSYNVSPLLSEDYELTFTPDSHVAYAKETTTIESILSDENMPLFIDYLTRTKETDPSYEASMTFYIFITLSVHDNRFFQMYISKRCNTPTVAISLQYGTYAGLEHMENNIPYIWK